MKKRLLALLLAATVTATTFMSAGGTVWAMEGDITNESVDSLNPSPEAGTKENADEVDATGTAEDISSVLSAADTTMATDWSELESSHNYSDNYSHTWIYTDPEAEILMVTFDERTATEAYCDFIEIYDGNENLIGSFSGAELAGKTVALCGGTVKIHFYSDSSNVEWGFKVSDISTTVSLAGCDISLSQDSWHYDGTEKEPEVTITGLTFSEDYGWQYGGTLTEDVDYTLTYSDNIEIGKGKVTATGLGIYAGTSLTKEFGIYGDWAYELYDQNLARITDISVPKQKLLFRIR